MSTQNRNRKTAGALFFIGWAESALFSTLAEELYPGYNARTNAISDLGVQTQTAALWSASVFVGGLLVVVGTLLLFGYGKGRRWSLSVFLLTGIGLMGVAIFNENAFTGLHQIFSLFSFLFGGISALVSVRVITGPFKWITLVFGAEMVIAVAVIYASVASPLVLAMFEALGLGIAEGIMVLPETIWFLAFGAYLMGSSGDERNSAEARSRSNHATLRVLSKEEE